MMRVNLEIVDDKGTKTSVAFEGDDVKDRLIQLINALDFQPTLKTSSYSSQGLAKDLIGEALTVKDRLKFFLKYEYPKTWFTSLDVKSQYERAYGSIPLSTVSTYLGRMHRGGILERRGTRAQREYRYISSEPEERQVPQDARISTL